MNRKCLHVKPQEAPSLVCNSKLKNNTAQNNVLYISVERVSYGFSRNSHVRMMSII